jgi:hypothetical protein
VQVVQVVEAVVHLQQPTHLLELQTLAVAAVAAVAEHQAVAKDHHLLADLELLLLDIK